MNGYDPSLKLIHCILYRTYYPRAGRLLARKCAGVYKWVGDEAHAEFLHRVQVEIKSTARERLAQWVAKQNGR